MDNSFREKESSAGRFFSLLLLKPKFLTASMGRKIILLSLPEIVHSVRKITLIRLSVHNYLLACVQIITGSWFFHFFIEFEAIGPENCSDQWDRGKFSLVWFALKYQVLGTFRSLRRGT